MRYHRQNVVCCEIVNGLTRTPLVGAYISPSMLEHLPDLEEALQSFRYSIVPRELSVDLDKARIPRSQRVADLLAEYCLIDLVRHLRQSRRFWNLKNLSQVRQVTVLRLRCDYILGTDRRRFKIFLIRYIHNFSSDHFALRARLLWRPTRCHVRHLISTPHRGTEQSR